MTPAQLCPPKAGVTPQSPPHPPGRPLPRSEPTLDGLGGPGWLLDILPPLTY